VKEAKAGAVMDAYNLGQRRLYDAEQYSEQCSLKKEWGFDGILMSDWGRNS